MVENGIAPLADINAGESDVLAFTFDIMATLNGIAVKHYVGK